MSFLQSKAERRCPHQVLSRVLLRLSAEALRHPAEKVSEMQRWLRRQRLPQAVSVLRLFERMF